MARTAHLLALAALGVSGPLYGQVAGAALKNLEQSPSVAVTVKQRSKAVTAALDIRVQVVNLTDTDIVLKQIRVVMPGEFVSSRRGQSKIDILDLPLRPEVQLASGTQRTFPLQVKDYSPRFQLPSLSLLYFVPGDYELQAVVTYRGRVAVDTDLTQLVAIGLEPPLSSLLWGGAFGAVVLAAFVATYRWKRREERARAILVEAVGTALAGAVCAVVALLLLYRLEGLELPIKVSVSDFFGGVVVGLFSYKIGEILYRQLWGDATAILEKPKAS